MAVMDGALFNLKIKDFWGSTEELCNKIREFNGLLTVNWHEGVFYDNDYPGWGDIYMKILGYLLAVVGIAGLAVAMIPEAGAFLPLPEIEGTTLMIASLVLAVIGVLIIMRTGSNRGKVRELPIYQGKDVVGYRRTK